VQKITPCLWFDSQAEAAVKLYTSVFSRSKIKNTTHYDAATAKVSGQPEGSVLTVECELEGQEFLAMNGGPIFKLTPALSFFVSCESEAEIKEKWAKLSAGGKTLMPLDKYPFAPMYGWCEDSFGLGWQLILAPKKQKISPAFLFVQKRFGKGEEAMNFYMSMFENSAVQFIDKDKNSEAILHASFTLAGQEFVLMESGMKEHQFDFTHGMSFIINCESQAEVDQYWTKLSKEGSIEECGWVTDKFGVSWQVVPRIMSKLMRDPNRKKSSAVMKAMLQMKKLDIAALQKAYDEV
jgi:predicted 3-demethylubiquinone-9 3-methyltransferase (glyoxalase superfamily)